jgi:hypothetical protein
MEGRDMAETATPEQQQKQEPDAEGNKVVDVMMGPYRGHRLKMPAAEADKAIIDSWARDPFSPLPIPQPKEGEADMGQPPFLSDEQRKAAHEASTRWAQAQWDASQQFETEDMKTVREAREAPHEPPPPNPHPPEERAMTPGEPGAYEVRRGPGRPPKSG